MTTPLSRRALALTAFCLSAAASPVFAQNTAPPTSLPTTLPAAPAPPPTPWTTIDPHATPQAPGAPAHGELTEHPAHEEHLDVAEHEPEHEGEGGFFFHAEYLLLQPQRDGAEFAIAGSGGRPIGAVESLYWESDSGFRLGGGYRLGDGWEISALYTYFHSRNHRDLADPSGNLYGTLVSPNNPFGALGLTSASGDTNFNFNVVDLVIGHTFHAEHGLEYTLSAGGRYARIDQNLAALYNGPTDVNDFVNSPMRFEGGGLVASGEARWKLWGGFGVYARATGSLLSGDFRSSLFESTGDGNVFVNVSDHFRKVVPVTEMALGLSWQTESFKVRVGYEISNWFGLIDSPDFTTDTSNKYNTRTGDLSLDGLSVMLEFDF